MTPLDSLSVLKDEAWCVLQLLIESAGHFPRILYIYWHHNKEISRWYLKSKLLKVDYIVK